MVTKNCSRKDCTMQNPQPSASFGTNKRVKSGLRPECNTCRKIEAAKAYKDNPEQFLVRNAKWKAKYPERAEQARIESELNAKPYRRHKQNSCATCPFVALDSCQLDVDHIDGNHSNNDPSNLQTLCANCHRLKTKLNQDGAYSGQHMKSWVKLRVVK